MTAGGMKDGHLKIVAKHVSAPPVQETQPVEPKLVRKTSIVASINRAAMKRRRKSTSPTP